MISKNLVTQICCEGTLRLALVPNAILHIFSNQFYSGHADLNILGATFDNRWKMSLRDKDKSHVQVKKRPLSKIGTFIFSWLGSMHHLTWQVFNLYNVIKQQKAVTPLQEINMSWAGRSFSRHNQSSKRRKNYFWNCSRKNQQVSFCIVVSKIKIWYPNDCHTEKNSIFWIPWQSNLYVYLKSFTHNKEG